jgi:hypothetical protein
MGYGRVNAYRALQMAAVYTGLNKTNEEELVWNIYPNPSKRILNIEYTGIQSTAMRIYDLTGKETGDEILLHNGLNTADISHLQAGAYIALLHKGGATITRRLTVIR